MTRAVRKRRSKKSVCFIACTHGDEPVGKFAMEELSEDESLRQSFDYIIGNPKALSKNLRYTEADLNRSAPGKRYGKAYEQRRAFEIMTETKPYRYVIDLHQTRANDRIILILMKLNARTLALASVLPVKDVLYWPSSEMNTGPLTQFVPRGIEIESGTKTSLEKTKRKLQGVIKTFLARINDISVEETRLRKRFTLPEGKRFYYVYEKIEVGDVADPTTLKDFGKVRTSKESFTALLFGKYAGLIGYKMKKIDGAWIVAHWRE